LHKLASTPSKQSTVSAVIGTGRQQAKAESFLLAHASENKNN